VAGRVAASWAHHGDHRALLRRGGTVAATNAKVHAIIVPSARPAPYLMAAAGLAEQLGCTLVVLCSKLAMRRKIVSYIEHNLVVIDLVVVDVSEEVPRLPVLKTSVMLANTRFVRRTDTSAKRNLGLALARMVGWKNVMFLDDDITVPDPADLRRAVAELPRHDGVGLANGGYPDNSVVCHAYRVAGGLQATFVGGGALAVPATRIDSFFPEIYNEDWFFLLGDKGLRPATMVGTAVQRPYDPFADPERARREEFGDVLAEGIFSLLDSGKKIQDADEVYWEKFLEARRSLIENIVARLRQCAIEAGQKERMLAALKAARGRLLHIESRLCVEYLEAWQEDRITWRRFLKKLPHGLAVEAALSHLSLRQDSTVRWNRTGPRRPEPGLAEVSPRFDQVATREQQPPQRPLAVGTTDDQPSPSEVAS